MMTIGTTAPVYTVPTPATLGAGMARPLETAAVAVGRPDERIARLGSMGQGYLSRIECHEACALRCQAAGLALLADQVLRLVANFRHKDSRLPAPIDLFTSTPLVSAGLSRSRLKVSATGFRRLRESIGTSVREMSGRRRYRVWGLN